MERIEEIGIDLNWSRMQEVRRERLVHHEWNSDGQTACETELLQSSTSKNGAVWQLKVLNVLLCCEWKPPENRIQTGVLEGSRLLQKLLQVLQVGKESFRSPNRHPTVLVLTNRLSQAN